MSRIAIVFAVVALLTLALPISNLLGTSATNPLSNLETEDPMLARIASTLAAKCGDCHTSEPALPLYARFPVASGMIERDVAEGRRFIDLFDALGGGGAAAATPETALAKIEHVLETGSMPPLRYKLLHWNSGVGDAEREQVITWIGQWRSERYGNDGIAAAFRTDAVRPLPTSFAVDSRKAALGKQLYHDTLLSGDGTLSCASCHELGRGGTDQAETSTGIRGQRGPINAPTTFNSGFQFLQFWDGRAATLEEQAAGPVANPIEMGAQWPDVIATLHGDGPLVEAFAAAYAAGLTQETVTDAIAEFERTLITPNSPFDRYLRGDDDAISDSAKAGYRIFKSSGCTNCHVGSLLGGRSFETMGLRNDYFSRRGNVQEVDYGRFNVTKDERDRYRFKVPTLRNITLTAPYFHDGSTSDLGDAVRVMARHQLGTSMGSEEVQAVVDFLGTLTGEYRGKPLS